MSFGEKKKERKNIENNEKICPHSAHTAQGPQGSIKVCAALVCLNMALNHKHLMYICVYVFGWHAKDVGQWHSVK